MSLLAAAPDPELMTPWTDAQLAAAQKEEAARAAKSVPAMVADEGAATLLATREGDAALANARAFEVGHRTRMASAQKVAFDAGHKTRMTSTMLKLEALQKATAAEPPLRAPLTDAEYAAMIAKEKAEQLVQPAEQADKNQELRAPLCATR